MCVVPPITEPSITLHYIILHHITVHHITLHHITLNYITSQHITYHDITSPSITLQYVTLDHIGRVCVVCHPALVVCAIASTLSYGVAGVPPPLVVCVFTPLSCGACGKEKLENVT